MFSSQFFLTESLPGAEFSDPHPNLFGDHPSTPLYGQYKVLLLISQRTISNAPVPSPFYPDTKTAAGLPQSLAADALGKGTDILFHFCAFEMKQGDLAGSAPHPQAEKSPFFTPVCFPPCLPAQNVLDWIKKEASLCGSSLHWAAPCLRRLPPSLPRSASREIGRASCRERV